MEDVTSPTVDVAGDLDIGPAPSALGGDDEPGFRTVRVGEGFELGVAFAFAHGGRILVAEKDGKVRVVRDGQLLAEPFLDLRAEVNAAQDRGLLGLAVHPQFPSVPYVYVSYTFDPPELRERTDAAGPDGHGARASRVVRVEADPRYDYERALTGSELVLLGGNGTLENMGGVDARNDYARPSCGARGAYVQDCIPADEVSHAVGSLAFGTEGALYVGHGDGCDYARTQPTCTRALDVDSLAGKILRIDPLTGRGLADNPFVAADRDLDSNRAKVFQLGLRNPFRFSIDALTGALYIGDVGWNEWEEVNRGPAGANFGWPCYEGGNGTSLDQGAYSESARCVELRTSGEPVTSPLFGYSHYDTGQKAGSAVLVGSVYRGTSYPPPYRGALFYADVNRQQLRFLALDRDGNVGSSHLFAEAIGTVTQISADPVSGDLHLMMIGGTPARPVSAIERLVFTGYGRSPIPGKLYTLRSMLDEGCVEAEPRLEAPQPLVRPCAPDPAQRWLLTNVGDDLYTIINEGLQLGLSVENQASPVSLQVGLRPAESRHEYFYLLPQGDGHQIISAESERCISVAPSASGGLSVANCASNPEQIFQIASETNRAPVFVPVERQTTAVETPVQLQASATDPEGSDLTYFATQLPNGLSIDPHTGVIMGTPTIPGTYLTRLRVTDGELQASQSFTWVIQNTRLPQVSLEAPPEGVRYRAGDVVAFAGSARDHLGVPISPDRLSWSLITHHNQHMHWGGFSAVYGGGGTLVYGDHGDNTSLEICVESLDAVGLAKACRALLPLTVEYTIDSEPSGLELPWEGVRRRTPFVVQTHVGGRRDLVAPLTQSGFTFVSWSDGGPASHLITIEESAQRLVATYQLPDAPVAP